jgi:CubicO group peptidase (beta-lactamase class C family)
VTFAAVLRVVWIMPLLCSCVDTSSVTSRDAEYWPTEAWRTAEPASVGIDAGKLAWMFSWLAREGRRIDGVIVIRHGYIIAEGYRQPYSGDYLHAIYSCTKSVVSACVGIAIERGLMPEVDTPAAELFPNHEAGPGFLTDSGPVTLAHLLTMTTGLDARDSYLYNWQGLGNLRASPDWVGYVLAIPNTAPPGTRFDYSNMASFLLAAALQEATGVTAEQFAAENLFAPLGIDRWRWASSPEGMTIGWSELQLFPRDLAKLGFLYLHGGRWDDEQVVPESWIRRSWTETVTANTLQPQYGYQWWTDQRGIYMALGHRGQYLIVDPATDLVMVVVSTLDDSWFMLPYDLYRFFVLPAIGETTEETDVGELDEAIAEFERGEGVLRLDGIPSATPPAERSRWAGTYDMSENPGGISALSFEFPPDETTVDTVITADIPGGEVRLPTTADASTTFVVSDSRPLAVRGGWAEDGKLVVLFEGVGLAWFRRLIVSFSEDGIVVVETDENRHTVRYTGTRR